MERRTPVHTAEAAGNTRTAPSFGDTELQPVMQNAAMVVNTELKEASAKDEEGWCLI
jgi:hypothetical protein